MTIISMPGADKATDERALFENALRKESSAVLTAQDIEHAWQGGLGGIWRTARVSLAAVPASGPVACSVNEFSSRMCESGTKGCNTHYAAAPAPVSGMPDLAGLTRYVQDLDDAILPVDQARENPSGAEYFAAADVERLLNPAGVTK